jgi:antibiotic biosynthesis monooxygenase (ABM) superfamily enzyme
MHYHKRRKTVKKVFMPSQSQKTITGHDVEVEAIGSVARQPGVKPKRWKLFLLTVPALYPLTLLIPEVLRITSDLIPALREGVVRGILAAALLVASVMFVIIPFCNRVFKKWLNSYSNTLLDSIDRESRTLCLALIQIHSFQSSPSLSGAL